MQVLDEVYHERYHRDALEPNILAAFDVIADELVNRFSPYSVIDVGCSGGALLRGLNSRNVPVVRGLDGANHTVGMTEGVMQHDLRTPLREDFGKFDVVNCTDVAEHVEPEFVETLCDTLVQLMNPNGFLLFGAATPDQDGLGHVNCQWVEYWASKFASRGVHLQVNDTIGYRRAIECRPEHAAAWWNKRNLAVYRRYRWEP